MSKGKPHTSHLRFVNRFLPRTLATFRSPTDILETIAIQRYELDRRCLIVWMEATVTLLGANFYLREAAARRNCPICGIGNS